LTTYPGQHRINLMKIAVHLPRTLGASLLAVPCVKSLQENFPAARITLISEEKLVNLLATLLPEFQVIALPDIKDIPGLQKNAGRVKEMGFDLALLLEESLASALLFYLARVPQRWGYDREGRGFMLTRKVRLRASDPRLHLKNHFLKLLEKLGLKVDDRPIYLKLPEPQLTVATQKLIGAGVDPASGFVAIKPGSSYGPARSWPLKNQLALVSLLQDKNIPLILVGSTASAAFSQSIKSEMDSRVVDFCGQLSLEETAGVIASATLFLGNDSGLTLLANFLGVPVVGLFGPTDPRVCGPCQPPAVVLHKAAPCTPCSYKNCPYDHRCLKSISPAEIFEVISGFISR